MLWLTDSRFEFKVSWVALVWGEIESKMRRPYGRGGCLPHNREKGDSRNELGTRLSLQGHALGALIASR